MLTAVKSALRRELSRAEYRRDDIPQPEQRGESDRRDYERGEIGIVAQFERGLSVPLSLHQADERLGAVAHPLQEQKVHAVDVHDDGIRRNVI